MFGRIFQINPGQLEKTYQTAVKSVKSGSDSYDTGKIRKNARSLMSALHSAMADHSNPFAMNYLKELNLTKGDYSNRQDKILISVDNAAHAAKELLKRNNLKPWELGIVNIMSEIYDLTRDMKFKNFMKKVYQDYTSNGEDSDLGTFASFYIALVFTMETTAYYFNLHVNEISNPLVNKSPKEMIQDMTDEHFMFVRTVVLNAIPILAYFQTSDYTAELKKLKETKSLVDVGQEDLGVGTIAGLVVLGIFTAIIGIRWIIYYLKTVRIDIGKGLAEEADILEVNIQRLTDEKERATNKVDKERLQKVIDKQKEAMDDFRERSKNILKEEKIGASEAHDLIQREDALTESSSAKNIEVII